MTAGQDPREERPGCQGRAQRAPEGFALRPGRPRVQRPGRMCSDRRRRERRQGKAREIPPARSRLPAAPPSCAPPAGRSNGSGRMPSERKSSGTSASPAAAVATFGVEGMDAEGGPVLRRKDGALAGLREGRLACWLGGCSREAADGGSRGPGARLRCWLAESLWVRPLRRPGRGSLSRAWTSPSRRPPFGFSRPLPVRPGKGGGIVAPCRLVWRRRPSLAHAERRRYFD